MKVGPRLVPYGLKDGLQIEKGCQFLKCQPQWTLLTPRRNFHSWAAVGAAINLDSLGHAVLNDVAALVVNLTGQATDPYNPLNEAGRPGEERGNHYSVDACGPRNSQLVGQELVGRYQRGMEQSIGYPLTPNMKYSAKVWQSTWRAPMRRKYIFQDPVHLDRNR